MSTRDDNILADEACASLREGIGRTRSLANEARHRLSELTSDAVYPGPAEFILADANASGETEGAPDRQRRAKPTA